MKKELTFHVHSSWTTDDTPGGLAMKMRTQSNIYTDTKIKSNKHKVFLDM